MYFVDTANLANKATQDIKDVYQMVADTLFEDFASADFANRKRSVAVNQQQHKLGPYNPRVPEQRFGDMRLSYSKVYSAFGQAVLDTQQSLRDDIRAYELAALMVKAFFGLAGSDGAAARRAGDQERDIFMREQMAMSEHPFDEFPDFSKGTVDVTPFQEYALTDQLLMDKDQRSLLERVESKVQLEIDRIMGAVRPEAVAREGGRTAAAAGARRDPRSRRHRRDQRGPHQAPHRRTDGPAAPEGVARPAVHAAGRPQAGRPGIRAVAARTGQGAPCCSATWATSSATASAIATSATRCARARSRNR